MTSVTVKTPAGKDAGTLHLDAEFFGVQPNVPVMHQVVTAQLAARRAGTQSTKTRAEVSGGGKKPFKQKGTGNARQGSTRAPHFSGGGVALDRDPDADAPETPTPATPSFSRSSKKSVTRCWNNFSRPCPGRAHPIGRSWEGVRFLRLNVINRGVLRARHVHHFFHLTPAPVEVAGVAVPQFRLSSLTTPSTRSNGTATAPDHRCSTDVYGGRLPQQVVEVP